MASTGGIPVASGSATKNVMTGVMSTAQIIMAMGTDEMLDSEQLAYVRLGNF
jgi:hypothetical protein